MLMACHLLYFIRQSKKSMKNKMIIVCVLLGLVLPLDGQTTLDDCIHYAWKHNLEFKNTQIEVQEAHTDYVAAMRKFMPSVSVQAEVGRHIGRSIDPGTNGYTSDSYNQGTVGMDVTLSLFEGFTRINRLRFTRLVQKEKEWSRLAKQNELAYQVVEAYYKVVLDEKLLQLAEEQLLLGKRYLKQTETFLTLGLRSASDLQEVKARHQGDVFRYSSYAKNREMSLLYLKELIGMKSPRNWLLCVRMKIVCWHCLLRMPMNFIGNLHVSCRIIRKGKCGNGLRVRSWLLLPDSLVLLFMPVFRGGLTFIILYSLYTRYVTIGINILA